MIENKTIELMSTTEEDRASAKDLLKQYRAMRSELRHIRRKMATDREDLILPSIGGNGGGGSNRGYIRQHLAESIDRVLDEESARADRITRNIYFCTRVVDAVDKIEDPELRLCLELRYMIDNCDRVTMPGWAEVARVMYGTDDDYQMRRLKYTHRRALDTLAMILSTEKTEQ